MSRFWLEMDSAKCVFNSVVYFKVWASLKCYSCLNSFTSMQNIFFKIKPQSKFYFNLNALYYGSKNARVSCSSISGMDLRYWKQWKGYNKLKHIIYNHEPFFICACLTICIAFKLLLVCLLLMSWWHVCHREHAIHREVHIIGVFFLFLDAALAEHALAWSAWVFATTYHS